MHPKHLHKKWKTKQGPATRSIALHSSKRTVQVICHEIDVVGIPESEVGKPIGISKRTLPLYLLTRSCSEDQTSEDTSMMKVL